ncbi:MAG: YIP1 family protein [Bacillota bacterium]
MFRKTASYLIRFIAHPKEASEEIAGDPRGVWAGFWFSLVFYFAYSIVALVYYLLNHLPVAKPFLTIPLEKWYLVQTFTTIPIGFAGMLSYSGLVYLLAKAAGGKGSFDATFASQNFTILTPWIFLTWLPEAFIAPILFFKGVHQVPWPAWVENLRVFVIPIAWMLAASVIALRRIHGINPALCFSIVVVSLVPMAAIMAVFIR